MISRFIIPSLMNINSSTRSPPHLPPPTIQSHPLTMSSFLKLFVGIKIENQYKFKPTFSIIFSQTELYCDKRGSPASLSVSSLAFSSQEILQPESLTVSRWHQLLP